MANRGQIITTVRLELQEATPGFWVNSELNTWADEAHADLVAATKQETKITITMAAQTESYALPADFYLARRVEMQTTAGSSTNWRELQPLGVNFRQPSDPVNSATTASAPYGYYIFGGSIYFIPIPDSAYSGTLYYLKNATPFTSDTDTPSYPEGIPAFRFDRLITLYVCALALRKRQDPAYSTYLSDYNGGRADMIREALNRGVSAPLIVSDDWARG